MTAEKFYAIWRPINNIHAKTDALLLHNVFKFAEDYNNSETKPLDIRSKLRSILEDEERSVATPQGGQEGKKP